MNTLAPLVYTPDQVANILHLSKKTVYQLIDKGEIIAKKLGKVYRIPATSLSFAFTGLDYDLYQAEKKDLEHIDNIRQELKNVRKKRLFQ